MPSLEVTMLLVLTMDVTATLFPPTKRPRESAHTIDSQPPAVLSGKFCNVQVTPSDEV